jgi:hypothetical protein
MNGTQKKMIIVEIWFSFKTLLFLFSLSLSISKKKKAANDGGGAK